MCIGEDALIVSFHGFGNLSLTLHSAVGGKFPDVLSDYCVNWRNILLQISEGINELHNNYKVLHNDIKSDNIVLDANSSSSAVNAVIIEFGKACDVKKGKHYRLSSCEREEYKVNHLQVAPDVRDGLCAQSTASDIAFGRIIYMISGLLKDRSLKDQSKQCMLYDSSSRPSIDQLKQAFTL